MNKSQKINDKIYIPVLFINDGEIGIGNERAIGGCMFFSDHPAAERFIKKTISENDSIKDAEYKILEYTRSE